MPLADTFIGLAEQGYRHQGAGHCRRCGARLEWFLTRKNRCMAFSLRMEMSVTMDRLLAYPSLTRYEPHVAVCPEVERFRRRQR